MFAANQAAEADDDEGGRDRGRNQGRPVDEVEVADRVLLEADPGGVAGEPGGEDQTDDRKDRGGRPDREDADHGAVEPALLRPALVAGGGAVGEAAVPGRVRVRVRVDPLGELGQRLAQRVRGRYLDQQGERLVAVFGLERALGRLADQLDRVADLLSLVEAAVALEGA